MGIELKVALMLEIMDDSQAPVELWCSFTKEHPEVPELFDHDNDLLIFSAGEQSEAVCLQLESYLHAPLESISLLLLPDTTDMRKEFSDYGFISHTNRIYAYTDNVYLFTCYTTSTHAQPYQAIEQMEEHLMASFSINGLPIYLTDNHSDELMARIAQAYRCSIQPFCITSA